MPNCCIIPLKKLSESKSRLANILSESQRKNLTLLMLIDVIETCSSSNLFDELILVCQERIDLKGVRIIEDKSELNEAIKNTIDKVKEQFDSFLILPADIPLIDNSDLHEIIKASKNFDLVISPSYDAGTNALLMKKGREIDLCYGTGRKSFLDHLKKALERGYRAYVYSSQRISLDLDDPEVLFYFANLDIRKQSVLYIKKLYEENRDNWLRRNT